MKNLTKTKLSLLLTMILCVMMVTVVSAEKANTSLKTLVEDTASSTKENKVDHLLDKYDEIQPRAIPCPSCSGYLVTRKIGTGAWRTSDTYACRQHSNCAIKESVRDIHYEDYCGGASGCGYYNNYTNQEYKTEHLR